MSIAKVFDPYTGGAIGGVVPTPTPPSGPISIGDLSVGYTFTDTAGVALSSYSYDNSTDTHTFSTNSIAVANETYAINNGANFTGPKWQKLLTYNDGTPVLAGDTFTFSVVVDNVSVGAARQYLVAVSPIQDPTSTVIGNLRPSGIYCLTTSVGTPGVGVLTANIGSAATTAGMILGSGATHFLGTATRYKSGGSAAATGVSVGNVTSRSDGNSWSIATTSQLSLGIFLSTNGLATTTGGDFVMRIKYNCTKLI